MRWIAARLMTLLGLAVLMIGGAPPATGVPITYQFSGVLDTVDIDGLATMDPRFGEIGVGDAFSGFFTYDSEGVGSTGTFICPDPPSACGVHASIEGIGFDAADDELFRYAPGTSRILGPEEFYFQSILATDIVDLAGARPTLALRLIDMQNSSPLATIPTLLDLSAFDTMELQFVFRNPGSALSNPPIVAGSLESLVLVPEPDTAALLVLGLAAIAGLRRRARSARRAP